MATFDFDKSCELDVYCIIPQHTPRWDQDDISAYCIFMDIVTNKEEDDQNIHFGTIQKRTDPRLHVVPLRDLHSCQSSTVAEESARYFLHPKRCYNNESLGKLPEVRVYARKKAVLYCKTHETQHRTRPTWTVQHNTAKRSSRTAYACRNFPKQLFRWGRF